MKHTVKKKKKKNQNKQHINMLWDDFKPPKIWIIGVPKGEDTEQVTEKNI